MNSGPRVVGLVLLTVLVGCSTPPAPEDHVATLNTTGSVPATVPVSSTSPPSGRPRERLDMTLDEIHELTNVYYRCLAENGYDTAKAKEAAANGATPDESRRPEAEAACLSKKPLPAWEYDLANPESADFVHAVVQCLRDNGVRYVDELPPTPGEDSRVGQISLGGPNNDAESISKGLRLIPTCEKEQTNR